MGVACGWEAGSMGHGRKLEVGCGAGRMLRLVSGTGYGTSAMSAGLGRGSVWGVSERLI